MSRILLVLLFTLSITYGSTISKKPGKGHNQQKAIVNTTKTIIGKQFHRTKLTFLNTKLDAGSECRGHIQVTLAKGFRRFTAKDASSTKYTFPWLQVSNKL